MASHVCDTWQAMCVTHGMPCVIIHGLFKAYIYGVLKISFWGGGGGAARSSLWEQQGEGGGREKRKGGKEKRKGGKERRKGGKGRKRKEKKRRKKGEEEREKKEEKEGVLRSEKTRTTKNPELRHKR